MNDSIYIPIAPGSKGFALFSDFHNRGGWSSGIDFLEDAGLRLETPDSAGTIITVGPTGERLDRSRSEFDRLVAAGESLLFRVWTESHDDMLCEFRSDSSGFVEYYWFGQLENDDERFASALLKRFKEQTSHGEAFLMVDWHALSENFDWMGLVSRHVGYAGVPPEILGLPLAFSSLLTLDLQCFSDTVLNGHVLYMRNHPPPSHVPPPEEVVQKP